MYIRTQPPWNTTITRYNSYAVLWISMWWTKEYYHSSGNGHRNCANSGISRCFIDIGANVHCYFVKSYQQPEEIFQWSTLTEKGWRVMAFMVEISFKFIELLFRRHLLFIYVRALYLDFNIQFFSRSVCHLEANYLLLLCCFPNNMNSNWFKLINWNGPVHALIMIRTNLFWPQLRIRQRQIN